jgi:hypothetical protein
MVQGSHGWHHADMRDWTPACRRSPEQAPRETAPFSQGTLFDGLEAS